MSAQTSEGVEPNLTPILDMVFQLITFFMLVINFKGASMDLSLQLPVLGSARPLEYTGTQEPLMLNIDAKGGVKSYGGQPVDIATFVPHEAKMLRLHLKALGTPLEEGAELPVPVIIRADKVTDFATVLGVIRLCQNQGYRQIALSAMTRQGGP
jgi:biopolymer transport protein ExbD